MKMKQATSTYGGAKAATGVITRKKKKRANEKPNFPPEDSVKNK